MGRPLETMPVSFNQQSSFDRASALYFIYFLSNNIHTRTYTACAHRDSAARAHTNKHTHHDEQTSTKYFVSTSEFFQIRRQFQDLGKH
jgi:hypothetical protein